MIRSTWRQPEAPRPSRNNSRGTAALFWTVAVLLQTPTALLAGGVTLLEPGGRPLCTGEAGLRWIHAVVSDGEDGYYLMTGDQRPALSWEESMDAFAIHLDSELNPLSFGDGLYSDSRCGALLLGGIGEQYSAGGASIAPGRIAVVIGAIASMEVGLSPVWVQSYDRAGFGQFGLYPVRVSTPNVESRMPFILPDGEGGLYCVWNEAGEYIDTQIGDLILQRFDATGRPLWEPRTVVSGGIFGGASWPVLASDGSGGVYVSFLEPRVEEAPDDHERIRVQRVAGDGSVMWPRGGLTPWTGNPGDDPVSAAASDGPSGAIVVLTADGKVRAQKMSPSGQRLWGPEGIVVSDPADPFPTPFYSAYEPRLLEAADGSLYVFWEEVRERGYKALVARRLLRDGRLPWPRPVTLAAVTTGFWGGQGAVLSDDSLAVVWQDLRSRETDRSDGSDIYAQVVDRRGRIKGPASGLPVVMAPLGQEAPFVVRPSRPFPTPAADLGSDLPQALIFWSDGRFPSLTGWSSAAFVAQAMAFSSEPQIVPSPNVTLRESTDTTLVLHGDDLYEGLTADAGEGVDLEATVVPDRPDGPGDTLTLRIRIGPAPQAAPGRHDLTIRNPDGGTVRLASFLEITLDERRVDVDRSGRVDGFDLASLARAFGHAKGEALYSWSADIDANGLVDGADLAVLASVFGRPIAG